MHQSKIKSKALLKPSSLLVVKKEPTPQRMQDQADELMNV